MVYLLDDIMKGCIIGCEGCNICIFESLIGVDVIIDDILEVVILLGFDLICCEIVCMIMEMLFKDGCIYLVCIEELVEKNC